MSKFIDISGNRYGRLLVLSLDSKFKSGKSLWKCVCDCGVVTTVWRNNLVAGLTKSCGCLHKEQTSKSRTTHGESGTRLYSIWKGMVRRCTNPEHPYYENYGGKGIKVCDEWLFFDNFLMDMNSSYQPDLTLDRIDSKGDYCKNNCRWVDRSMQNFNRDTSSKNTSGKIGVSFDKNRNKWQTRITKKNGKVISLGYFENFEDAVAAREAAELEYFGYIKNVYYAEKLEGD